MKLNGLAINFLGDSITEGCGTSGPDKAFAHLLEEACQLSASRNYGIGGTRIARQQTPSADPKIDRDFCLRASEMDENADVVVVFGGTNDYGHGDAPFGRYSDDTVSTFCGACRSLFTRLIEKYGREKVAVITPLHRSDESSIPRKKSLSEYVEVIRRMAADFSLPVLDMWKNDTLNPNVADHGKKYFSDGLHPNDEGHALFGEAVAEFLQSIPEPQN